MNQIPLTDQEYQDIHQIVQSLPPGSRSVRVAHGQIIRQNGQLRRFGGWKALNEAYIIKRDNEIQFQKIDSNEAQQRILSINTNPGYLLHNLHPMYASRSHLPWSQTENETLRSIIEKSTEKKPD